MVGGAPEQRFCSKVSIERNHERRTKTVNETVEKKGVIT